MTGQNEGGATGGNSSSTRSFFILLGLCVVGLIAFLGYSYTQANAYVVKKAEARKMIESLGGTIDFFGLSGEPSPGSNWLIREFGVGENQEELWNVDLSNQKVSANDLEQISDFDWIRSLDLSQTQIDDAAADQLIKFSKLRELSIANTAITDAGIEKFSQLQRLIKLDTTGTSVTDASLAKLDQELSTTNFEEQRALADFDVEGILVDTTVQSFKDKLEDEKNILIRPPNRTTRIQIVNIEQITPENIEALSHLTNAKSFYTVKAHYPPSGLDFLTNYQLLEEVTYLGGNIQDSDLAIIAALPNLKSAILDGSFTNAGFAGFQKSESLEFLKVSGVNITPEILTQIQGMKNLRELDLFFSTVTAQGDQPSPTTAAQLEKVKQDLALLSSFPNLSRIKIYGNLVVNEALEPLGNLKNLQELELDQRTVTEESIASLRAALPNCKIELTQPAAER